MRFVIDENVPLLVATELEALGHDCIAIARISPAAHDVDVMAIAREEQRLLVTFDSDFARMIFHELRPPPPGVVYMQARPNHAMLVSRIFLTIFEAGDLPLAGRFIILDSSGTIRSLPLGSDNG